MRRNFIIPEEEIDYINARADYMAKVYALLYSKYGKEANLLSDIIEYAFSEIVIQFKVIPYPKIL